MAPMKRENLEHVIRAAATITQDSEIIVIGSQAILAQFPEAPETMLFSQEADVYPRNRPERSIDVEGAIGDGSQFHDTFGYYAHGVGPETAKAPTGWEKRLVAVRVHLHPTRDEVATGWCIEVHDLILAKCVAGRERDWEFATEAIRANIVDPDELLDRVSDLPLAASRRDYIHRALSDIVTSAKSDL